MESVPLKQMKRVTSEVLTLLLGCTKKDILLGYVVCENWPGMPGIFLIIFKQHLASLFIQGWFWKWFYKQTPYYLLKGKTKTNKIQQIIAGWIQKGKLVDTNRKKNFWGENEIRYMLNGLTMRTWRNPRLGFQSFFRVFTQISPFVAMFGWNILVRK